LLGIISVKALRLTHAKFLNDKAEMLHGFEFVSKVLKDKSDKGSELTIKRLTKVRADWEKDFGDFNVFVAAFSERGDTLEQWRGYVPLGGCSIGFSTKGLRNAAHKRNFWMLPCLYSGADKSDRISKVLQSVKTNLTALAATILKDFPIALAPTSWSKSPV